MLDLISYFESFESGDNITITYDFMDNVDKLKILIEFLDKIKDIDTIRWYADLLISDLDVASYFKKGIRDIKE